jgi:threonine dehydrogenase-like Zn-dependent dehydrogenase
VRALIVEPGVAHSTRVEDVDEPSEDGVRLRVLEIGVCGTDREIAEGNYGWAPAGHDRLVIGHESLGRVHRACGQRLLAGGLGGRGRPPARSRALRRVRARSIRHVP